MEMVLKILECSLLCALNVVQTLSQTITELDGLKKGHSEKARRARCV